MSMFDTVGQAELGMHKANTYDYIVKLVRQYGQYPIQIGEYEEQT